MRRLEPKSEEMTDQSHLPFLGFSSLIKRERTTPEGLSSRLKLLCQWIFHLFSFSRSKGKHSASEK
jgi:hypothetical protein